MLQQTLQQPVPLGQEFLPPAAQVQGGRRVGQHGQRGGLGPGKLRCRPAEIAPGRGFQPHHIAAEGRMGGVQSQNLPLGIAQFQPRGLHGFNHFLPDGTFFLPGQTNHLHGDGTAAAHHVAAFSVGDGRTHQRPRIHAGMPPEMPVLELHQRCGKARGHGVARRETPLFIGRNPRPQQLSFRALHHRRVAHAPEQLPRQAQQPCCEQRGCHCNEYFLTA